MTELSSEDANKWTELYVVEKTVEVVADLGGLDTEVIRIEALRDVETGKYSTRAHRQGFFNLETPMPKTHTSGAAHLWVSYGLPPTNRDTADDAIRQALGFLAEKKRP